MKRTTQEIADFVGGELRGDAAVEIESVASLDHAGPGDLAYAEPIQLRKVPLTNASCVLVQSVEISDRTVIVVDNPRASFAKVTRWLIPDEQPVKGVHPTAIVAESAQVEDGVSVGAWTVIEAGAKIGKSTNIYPGCYIGRNCQIGSDCNLFPNVVLYAGVEISHHVTIHAGTIIGSDGFGFVLDGSSYLKVPQVGSVIIEAHVEIGANSCVDRGALDNTIVEEGTKIDNLCQIAHNVKIGSHAIISAQTGIAGSSIIGSRATIGGQVGIADYCRIDPNAVVAAQCGVPSKKRVPAGEVFWGTPARPLKEIKVQQAYLSRLPKLAEEIQLLRAEVDELRSRSG